QVQVFAANIVSFLLAHSYDGVDFDWEGNVSDPGNDLQYTDLVARVGAALPGRTFTIDVFSDHNLLSSARSLGDTLSQVNVMCYDMDAFGSTRTWYNDALYDPIADNYGSCDQELAFFTSGGGNTLYGIPGDPGLAIPAGKMGVGVPFYGRKFTPATAPGGTG